jgi:hypothetical protein
MQKKEQELMKEYRNMMENLLTESDHKWMLKSKRTSESNI